MTEKPNTWILTVLWWISNTEIFDDFDKKTNDMTRLVMNGTRQDMPSPTIIVDEHTLTCDISSQLKQQHYQKDKNEMHDHNSDRAHKNM